MQLSSLAGLALSTSAAAPPHPVTSISAAAPAYFPAFWIASRQQK